MSMAFGIQHSATSFAHPRHFLLLLSILLLSIMVSSSSIRSASIKQQQQEEPAFMLQTSSMIMMTIIAILDTGHWVGWHHAAATSHHLVDIGRSSHHVVVPCLLLLLCKWKGSVNNTMVGMGGDDWFEHTSWSTWRRFGGRPRNGGKVQLAAGRTPPPLEHTPRGVTNLRQ